MSARERTVGLQALEDIDYLLRTAGVPKADPLVERLLLLLPALRSTGLFESDPLFVRRIVVAVRDDGDVIDPVLAAYRLAPGAARAFAEEWIRGR